MICTRCDKLIDEHKADRYTDTCVADVVMGLEVYADHGEYLQAGFPHAAEWSKAVHYPAYWYDPEDGASGWAMSVHPYSVDMNEAMRVEERMNDEEKVLIHWYIEALAEEVGVILTTNWGMYRIAHAGALQRCRAALRAVIGLEAKEGKK
jgi:hypothetical protein